MPSIEAVAEQITRSGIPVLLLDTCNYFDIIRLAISDEFRRGEAEAAVKLSGLISASPPTCLLVSSSIIGREWDDNLLNVTKKAADHLSRLEKDSGRFHEACRALGIAAGSRPTGYSSSGLIEALRGLARQLLDKAIHLETDDSCLIRATDRVLNKMPPAQESKEVKDCIVIEEYLAVCRTARSGGHAGKLVFFTTNKNDYCFRSNIHPLLAPQFEAIELTFAKNLPHALHELTH